MRTVLAPAEPIERVVRAAFTVAMIRTTGLRVVPAGTYMALDERTRERVEWAAITAARSVAGTSTAGGGCDE